MTTAEDPHRSAIELLFTDASGDRVEVEDLISAGLDGGYNDRLDDLGRLADDGTPLHRLLATTVLTSWGDSSGFRRLADWARHPGQVPWADAPVVLDRFTGADAAFETLAEAVLTSFWNDVSPQLRADQFDALRALLEASRSCYVGTVLSLATVRDAALTHRLQTEVDQALDVGAAALEQKLADPFDRALQTASFVLPEATIDDDRAAYYGRRLLASGQTNLRSRRELVQALAAGTGPATFALLTEMGEYSVGPLAHDVVDALGQRSRSSDGC